MEHLSVSVYRVPTDLPGGDATLAWDATTPVLMPGPSAPVRRVGAEDGSAARFDTVHRG
ncbi:hypothetical protein [Streptomyces sp. ECR3.8]|uniref:hypothetical protein n=1 Tax=Streptomyces sp. ECR3.8 TaxID=3461009 RepID=UPI004042F831